MKDLKDSGAEWIGKIPADWKMVKLGMDSIGLTPYVDLVVGQDLVTKHKPDPEGINFIVDQLKGSHDNVIMVGDSIDDILVGQNANAFTIGYSSSEYRKQLLEAQKPNRLIDDLSLIPAMIQEDKLWNKHSI